MPAPYTPATIVRGDDLMLFKDGKSIAFATAHTLSMSTETADVSSKDHGIYSATEPVKVTWEITSDNLYTETAFDALFSAMTDMQEIEVEFGLKNETDKEQTVANGDLENWTPKTGNTYKGKAFITSLSANANTGEKATFNITLSGVGKLVKSAA